MWYWNASQFGILIGLIWGLLQMAGFLLSNLKGARGRRSK